MKKKSYKKPEAKKIKIDNEISMVMMSSPPVDPESSLKLLNPLRWWV